MRAAAMGLLAAGLVVAFVVAAVPAGSIAGSADAAVGAAPSCADALRVTTSASFAPVLEAVGPALAAPGPGGRPCLRLEVEVADGRTAAARAAGSDADLWIPDDGAWAGRPGPLRTAVAPAAHTGATVAVSPLYLITDVTTADRLVAAGGGWLALAGLLGSGQVTMAIRDPAAAGDGLLAAGAVGEAVWRAAGMDAAAIALADAVPAVRTVPGTAAAMPRTVGEVGVVAEYALLPLVRDGGTVGARILAPADHTSALRHTWLPTVSAADDPATAQRLERLWEALTGPGSSAALAGAGLRRPGIGLPPGARPGELPLGVAPLFDVLDRHRVDHVFASWYWQDRKADVLAVVDVSGSMGAVPATTGRPLIDVVKQGLLGLEAMMPDDAGVGLWEFGVGLTPPVDHRVLLDRADLGPARRTAFRAAVSALAPQRTGSGLHDTVLAAYTAARDGYRPGVPDHVVVFTDGRDEADPGSLTREQLAQRLAAARDPRRPVQLSIITFGEQDDATLLADALAPFGAYVDQVTAPDEVRAAFLHVAAGGLHH